MHPKNKNIAALLAIFLGTIGLHKLYLGRIGGFIGILVLLVISIRMDFPLVFFISIIQGLKLFFMSNANFDKKYNPGYISDRRGPLDLRREAQLKRYEQLPGQKSRQSTAKTSSAQSIVKATAFKNSGIKKYKDFDLQDAIQDFKSGLALTPNDPALHFNIACAYSLTEQKTLTYRHLALAVASGLKDVERILTHDDLAYIRIQPEFDAFRASGFKNYPDVKADGSNEPQQASEQNHHDNTPLDDSLLSKLKKLSELREMGAISEQEFDFERKKVLRQ